MGDDIRLEINAGGLDGFFNGVCSFIAAGNSNAASNGLINSFQNVTNRTCGISGGVGTLNTALGYINTRKTVEETRKFAVQNVKRQTDSFIKTSLRVDKEVAGIVSRSTEAFYQTNPWLRPPAPPSDWERFCGGVGGAISSFCSTVGDVINSIGDVVGNIGKFFKSIGEVFIDVLNGIKEFFATHWKEILIDVAFVVLVVIAGVAVVAAGTAAIAAGATVAGVIFGALITASVGSLCGVGGQLFSDFLTSRANNKPMDLSWQNYVGAAIGGAIGGATGNSILGGLIGGGISKFIGGKLAGKTADEILPDMAIGIGVGLIGGVIGSNFKFLDSFTGGRNAWATVYKSGITKIVNGNALEMSWKVFFKGTSAKLINDFYKNISKWGIKRIIPMIFS